MREDGRDMALSNDAKRRTAQDISDVPDAELVALAQTGDDRAFALLVARCEPMLRAQVARFRLPHADAEDVAQEGLLGLLSAVRTFRPDGGASFRTYAAVCVRNRLLSALRRTAGQADESLDATEDDGVQPLHAPAVVDPESLVLERESAERLLSHLRDHLTPREYTVLLRYMDGYSYAEIAAELHMSAKAVDNALWRARRKVRELLSVENSFG